MPTSTGLKIILTLALSIFIGHGAAYANGKRWNSDRGTKKFKLPDKLVNSVDSAINKLKSSVETSGDYDSEVDAVIEDAKGLPSALHQDMSKVFKAIVN